MGFGVCVRGIRVRNLGLEFEVYDTGLGFRARGLGSGV
jgi:hypothetical protein